MSQFILDASVAMSWCFSGEGGRYSEEVLTSLAHSSAVVPSLWLYEITNVLLTAERKKRLSDVDSHRYLNLLFQLPIEVDSSPPIGSELLRLGRECKLTAYDATYLEMSIRRGMPIATLDPDLKKSAKKLGLQIYLAGKKGVSLR